MAVSSEELKEILRKQQEQFEKSQLDLITAMKQQFQMAVQNSANSTENISVDFLANSIPPFEFDPSNNVVFSSWFGRWRDTFDHDFSHKDGAWKSRLLLRKLGTKEYECFANYILPKLPSDFTFTETVDQLTEMFDIHQPLSHTRYNCLKMTKRESDDYISFAGHVNRECERFKLQTMTENEFKCLIFITGLTSPKYSEMRARLLSKLEQDKNITVEDLMAECNLATE